MAHNGARRRPEGGRLGVRTRAPAEDGRGVAHPGRGVQALRVWCAACGPDVGVGHRHHRAQAISGPSAAAKRGRA
jgi:hypothetical protein